MAGGTYRYDLADLEAVAGGLGALAADFEGASRTRDVADGALGYDGLRTAVREFVEVDNGPPNLPLQRARVEPASLPGTLNNISYIQRIRTLGGLPSIRNCSAAELGMRVSVPYEADYVFWRQANS